MSRSGELAGRSAERTPFGWAALAAALAVSVSSAALAQTPPASTTTTSTTEQGDGVLLEADQLVDDQQTRTVTAAGDVQVRYQTPSKSGPDGAKPRPNSSGSGGTAIPTARFRPPNCTLTSRR